MKNNYKILYYQEVEKRAFYQKERDKLKEALMMQLLGERCNYSNQHPTCEYAPCTSEACIKLHMEVERWKER